MQALNNNENSVPIDAAELLVLSLNDYVATRGIEWCKKGHTVVAIHKDHVDVEVRTSPDWDFGRAILLPSKHNGLGVVSLMFPNRKPDVILIFDSAGRALLQQIEHNFPDLLHEESVVVMDDV